MSAPGMGAPVDPAAVDELVARVGVVRARIASAGGDERVTLIGVTKGHPAATLRVAAAAGLTDVGESYAQELAAKADVIAGEGLRCHFVGQLQTNKVRQVAGVVAVYQSVDRPSLVAELVRRAPGASVLVQVDLAGVAGRGGCAFDDAASLVDLAARSGLSVEGLMGVAPLDPDEPGAARRAFTRLAALREELGLRELSIGMSDDLEDAVACGSTMVRVGTALFGPRPPRA